MHYNVIYSLFSMLHWFDCQPDSGVKSIFETGSRKIYFESKLFFSNKTIARKSPIGVFLPEALTLPKIEMFIKSGQ